MTYEETKAELLADSTLYCCYCGGVKTTFACCGEVHFETFANMDLAAQDDFIFWEMEGAKNVK